MNKKVVKKIIIFCIILIILLGFIILLINFNYSKLHMKILMKKGISHINYEEDLGESKKFAKQNVEKIIYNNGDILYYNYKEKQTIFISIENKTINISTMENNESSYSSIYSDIDEKEYEYKGLEKVHDNECYVVDFYTSKNDDNGTLLKRIWINKKIGVIEKVAYYNKSKTKEKLISEQEYNVHTGEVTDDDISQPNLNNYPNFNIINN